MCENGKKTCHSNLQTKARAIENRVDRINLSRFGHTSLDDRHGLKKSMTVKAEFD
jgi:hypothetical protein